MSTQKNGGRSRHGCDGLSGRNPRSSRLHSDFFASVRHHFLGVADSLLRFASCLFHQAFGFLFVVAHHVTELALDFARRFFDRAFDLIFGKRSINPALAPPRRM
jgi:hypothetical protein